MEEVDPTSGVIISKDFRNYFKHFDPYLSQVTEELLQDSPNENLDQNVIFFNTHDKLNIKFKFNYRLMMKVSQSCPLTKEENLSMIMYYCEFLFK